MGATVNLIAPSTLMAEGLSDYGANIYNNFKEGLNNVDNSYEIEFIDLCYKSTLKNISPLKIKLFQTQ